MIKKDMVEKTIEGFIRELKNEGHSKYASELRNIIAMSRRRREAESALTSITITLLTHILKYIALPQSRDKNKWHREIKAYLAKFDIRNESPRGRPWLPIEFIKKDLNDVLTNPKFSYGLTSVIEGKDLNRILSLLGKGWTLKSLGINLFYGSNNDLKISINNIEL
jgi:hypothetical protein